MRSEWWISLFFLIGCSGSPIVADDEATNVPQLGEAAQEVPLAQVLDEVRVEFKLPGLSAGIVSRHGLLEMASAGLRKSGSEIAVTDGDRWHLGSCTKAMTATLLASLVQDGLLTWDTTLASLFPGMLPNMSEDFKQITLDHLLTHRSGLPANGPWWELGETNSSTEQRAELLRVMLGQPLNHKPGSKFEYSNVGYALAGLMVEAVLEKSWEVALQERIFKPLGMDGVGFGVPGTKGSIDQPWGHRSTWLGLGPLKSVQLDNAVALGPAGTVHASIDAWAKFIAIHLDRSHPLLEPPAWDRLHTPPVGFDYAMGWRVADREWAKDEHGEGVALRHSGSNTYNYCVCWLAPQRGFAVIAATNTGQSNAARALDKVCSELIKRAVAHQW